MTKQGLRKLVSCHKIPNMALGKVITRHVVRVCFPHMYLENTVVPISQAMLGRIYDQALKPAVDEVSPMSAGRWPVTYAAALAGATHRRTGQYHLGSVDIDALRLPAFATAFLVKLAAIPGCEDAYFLHEIRGTKGQAVHNPADEDARWDALNHVLEAVDRGAISQDDWMVDVALEYGKPGHVMQWLQQGHLSLLRVLLPSVATDAHLAKIIQGSAFGLDRAADLADFCGFRLVVPRAALMDGVHYVNAYTTDKSQSYHLHPTFFTEHHPSELIGAPLEKLLTDLVEMSKIYAACRGKWDEPDVVGSPGNARMEIRVPLRLAGDALISIPAAVLAASTVAVPVWTWW
ncbi:hypothetical protein FIBSPDRAFT_751853 [Athelia psychrophila]|uniref:Uncharacterized protein n=1 Tax=Athelia psychrophila TaxID=1759441 RepID=A0A166D894_9AGAM|nr:hypothetical protein FIBSPDRAFT_751853 [Fibularhizoctonia sp. CBS 109695]